MSTNEIQVELAINFNDHEDLTKVSEIIKTKGLELVSSNFENKTVQIRIPVDDSLKIICDTESTGLNLINVQRSIEQQTGLPVVVKGLGNSQAAVAELTPPSSNRSQVYGVVRLSQLDNNLCYADGSIEGHIEPATRGDSSSHLIGYQFAISIHEYGDLSNDFISIGKVEIELARGVLRSDQERRLDITFRGLIPNCNLSQMIGRSVALIMKDPQSVADGIVLCAAVLARGSEISRNDKKICACSGKTIWEERRDNS